MAIGMRTHRKYLDGKRCLEVWCQTGSVYKSRQVLASEGYVNPRNGEMPSQQGVWNASWLYIIDNMVEARKMIDEVWKANGHLLTDKDWYTLVTKSARYILPEKKFNQFMKEHEYLRPYEQMAKEAIKSKRAIREGQGIHPVAVSE